MSAKLDRDCAFAGHLVILTKQNAIIREYEKSYLNHDSRDPFDNYRVGQGEAEGSDSNNIPTLNADEGITGHYPKTITISRRA